MGEMADAYLNGDFDMETGEYIGPGDGFPRTLVRESKSRFRRAPMNWSLAERKPFPCPTCGRRFPAHGSMRDHARGVHKIILDALPEEHWAIF